MFGLSTITTVLIDTLVTAAIGLVCYLYGIRVGEDHVAAQSVRDAHTAQVAYEASQKAVADVVNKSEAKNAAVQQKLFQLVQSNPVFHDCHSGPDSLRDFNSAIPGWTDSSSDRKLPAPHAPDR